MHSLFLKFNSKYWG